MVGATPALGAQLVPYLPQDNEETPEAEELVASLLVELDGLLRAPAPQFWQAVRSAPALPQFLGTYLQFCRRPHDAAAGEAGPPFSRLQLARDVFLLLLRLVSDETAGGGVPRQEQARLLYGKQLLDVPMLLDIAALYTRGNPELTRELLAKALQLGPRWAAELEGAAGVIGANLAEIHGTCASAAQQLGRGQTPALLQGVLDGLAYLADACHTLAALAEAHPPAAPLLLKRAQLPRLLPALFEQLLPAAAAALQAGDAGKAPGGGQAEAALAQLQAAVLQLHAALLLRGCLQPGPEQARVASLAAQRGADLLSLLLPGGRPTRLAAVAQQRMGLSRLLAAALEQGHVQLDRLRRDSLFEALGDAAAQAGDSAQAAERRAQLAQIREVLPGYGDGFLAACLDAAGGDAARVITQLLEGSLPEELRRLDPQMQLAPAPAAAAGPSRSSGGGAGPAAPTPAPAPAPAAAQKSAAVHKGTAYALRASPQEAAVAKLHALASQWEEYEDEYDDTWDDTPYNADTSADTRGDRMEALPAAPAADTQAKGGRPLWVLGGRIYAYRKEGATPVPNQAAADQEVRAQRAAEQAVHGLGAGGNKPAAAPEAGSSQQGGDGGGGRGDGPPGGGRGGRGRGGRAGPSDTSRARVFKSEHKAALGNHHRKDRALRKQGGPMS